jgi:hypothetical protein
MQAFKRLLKEDSMDYSINNNTSKKRNRVSLPQAPFLEPSESHVQGHVPSLRTSLRASFPLSGAKPFHPQENDLYSGDDYDDDYVGDADFGDSDDENYEIKVGKRRRSSVSERSSLKKHHL